MTFKKSYVPGILGSVLTLTVIMAAPVKAETKEETILNKTDWSTMAAANVEGYANIRSEASVDSEIVGVLMPGYAVAVTEKGNEWSKISSNGVEGYIKNEYLVFGEEAKAHYRNMCGIIGVVQADSLRVREAASTDSAQVGTLTQNGEVSVFGEEADWYQIQYSGSSAYVHGDYVTLSEELKGAVSMEEYQASQACVASSAAAASTAGSASVISADSNDVGNACSTDRVRGRRRELHRNGGSRSGCSKPCQQRFLPEQCFRRYLSGWTVYTGCDRNFPECARTRSEK